MAGTDIVLLIVVFIMFACCGILFGNKKVIKEKIRTFFHSDKQKETDVHEKPKV